MSSRLSSKTGILDSPVRRNVAAASAAETVDGSETIDDRGVISSPTSVRVKSDGMLQEHAGRLGELGLGVFVGRIVLDRDFKLQMGRPMQRLGPPGKRFHQPLDLSQPKRKRQRRPPAANRRPARAHRR